MSMTAHSIRTAFLDGLVEEPVSCFRRSVPRPTLEGSLCWSLRLSLSTPDHPDSDVHLRVRA